MAIKGDYYEQVKTAQYRCPQDNTPLIDPLIAHEYETEDVVWQCPECQHFYLEMSLVSYCASMGAQCVVDEIISGQMMLPGIVDAS